MTINSDPQLNDTDIELLSAYIDRRLSDDERAALEQRLKSTPALRSALDDLLAFSFVLIRGSGGGGAASTAPIRTSEQQASAPTSAPMAAPAAGSALSAAAPTVAPAAAPPAAAAP